MLQKILQYATIINSETLERRAITNSFKIPEIDMTLLLYDGVNSLYTTNVPQLNT